MFLEGAERGRRIWVFSVKMPLFGGVGQNVLVIAKPMEEDHR